VSQVQKKREIIEYSQDEDFFNDDLLEKLYSAESSKPYSVTISRSSNPEKKLMGVFEDSEGKKIKTTHFGQRGASDYTKHGDTERMGRYNTRHKSNENWNDPLSAGALSKWILWNKPGLKSSFDDYKSRFGLKGSIKVSKSAEDFEAQYEIGPTSIYDLHETFEPYGGAVMHFGDYATKVMMTPKEFLSLCISPARKDRRQDKLEKYRKSFEQGIPLHIPVLEIKSYGEEGDWVVSGHEGRHRAQVLIDMGYGDVKIPISIWPQKWMGDPYSQRGRNPKVNEVLKNIHLWPQSQYKDIEWEPDNEMVFIHEDDITTNYKTGEVIKLASEDWEDIDWESHEPTNDPSPFETVEWEKLPLPPANIVFLMKAFEKAGYEILVVGGAVRDAMLDLPIKDYDLATNATPDEVKEVVDGLKGYRYVLGPQAEKSILNLTSLVNIPNEKEAIEITTYRKELGYAGDRTKGDFIPAETFEQDAERRDLTINAMGMTHDGILKDPMNGKEDLENNVIRAVGDPNQRFVEDPLRMIRAIRFSTKYGMPIDPATYQAILDNVDLIPTLSAPRLRQEIGKVLVHPKGYQMLMETGILPVLMPEFRNMTEYHHKLDYHPEGSLYNHYIEAFKKYTTIPNRSELGAWALLFHDIAKPQTAVWNEEGGYHTFYGHDKKGAQLILDKYNNQVGPFEFSKKELQEIAWTTEHHLGKFWESMKPMKVSTMRNDERFPRLVEVVTGDTMGIRRGGDEELQRRLNEINEITDKVNEQKAKVGKRPKWLAQRLMQEVGMQGKQIGEALKRIEQMVSTGDADSYEQAYAIVKLETGSTLTEKERKAHGAGS